MSDMVARLNTSLSDRYTIERQLGEGGMATVYLARDLRHQRRVALKVLKPELAAVVGAERFLAEIRTTANLQHPHILPLFDSGEADKLLFYVMPYVEGESLRDRLDHEHQLPVDEAVRIATNVAEALDYAHSHGVVHRDIKPANILLQSGKPVVSDFGIALAITSGAAGRLTETGLSLGTPHYMSPEQATGDQSVGPATDVYALGCVLYEMLVGEPPYTGSTPQAVLGKIIAGELPSATEARKSVPPNVDAAIRKALEKVPADRFRSAQEFVKALADSGFRHDRSASVPVAYEVPPRARVATYLGWSLAAILAAVMAWTARSDAESTGPTIRTEIALWPGAEILGGRVHDVSPDGLNVVLAGRRADGLSQLWLRTLADLAWVQVPGTENAVVPRFSPDGRSIAFRMNGALHTTSLGGGTPRTVLDAGATRDLTWGTDGYIYYGNTNGGISRVPAEGGNPEAVTTLRSGETNHSNPDVLPDGRAILFRRQRGSAGEVDEIAIARLGMDEVEVLFEGRTPRYLPTGHVVFGDASGRLTAVPFDASRLEVTGPPTLLLEGVMMAPQQGASRFAISTSGTLVYFPGVANSPRGQLEWVSRQGISEPVDPADPPLLFIPVNLRVPSVDVSANGRRLAVSFAADDDLSGEIYVKDLPRGPLQRLTTSPGTDFRPVWMRDGETVAYIHEPGPNETDSVHVRTMPGDGRSDGAYEILLRRPRPVWEVSFSPDGAMMVFREGRAAFGEGDIGILHLSTGSTEELLGSEANERAIALSPDGRWLALVSDVSGTDEVYVRPFPLLPSGRIRVSRSGGREPVWSPAGRELFYREPESGSMMAVSYGTGDDFGAPEPVRLFDASAYAAVGTDGSWHAYDVAPDGRFAMIRRLDDDEEVPGLILVQNFFAELGRVVPN